MVLNEAFKHRLTYPRPRHGTVPEIVDEPYGTPPALRAVDAEQLARVSHELTQGIAIGAIGGMPLRTHFARSITAYYGERHNAAQHAVAEFLRSPDSKDVDMLGLCQGRSVIEAFGMFLLRRREHATTVHSELLAGLLRTLARYPEPGFLVHHPNVLRTGPSAWAGYEHDPTPGAKSAAPQRAAVHVACGGRYFTGVMSGALLAALLWDADPRPEWVRDVPGIDDLRRGLRAKGLLP